MILYLEGYTPRKVEYGSIEDGFTRLTLPRGAFSEGAPPDSLVLDYWEVFEE